MNILEILENIKTSKKYKHIAEEIIVQEINSYLKKNPQHERYKDEKILKEIKASLYKKNASFSKNPNQALKLMQELEKTPENEELIRKILETNKSGRERLDFYPLIYKKIFENIGKPNKIIDLGGGLNAFSLVFSKFDLKNLEYYSYDINERDSELVNRFLKLEKIGGKAEILDLSRIENYNRLEKAEVCFMFKFIDTIERDKKGHKFAEEIIKFILNNKTRFIVASFSTRTLGGKNMNFPYRGWIERMLERNKMNFDILKFENEIFYIISKV